jgi:peptidoglycan/LPS O-acetylase OafA/YrhL
VVQPAAARTSGRLRSVDALRAIAAFLVVLNHSALGLGHPSAAVRWLLPFGKLGYEGVSLFLVISGFSIHLRWAQRRDKTFSPLAFWRRRLVRLYPTYYAALATIVIVTVGLFGLHGLARERGVHEHFPLWLTTGNHLSVVGANFFIASLLPQAWSLALEEQIYALYTAIARFVREVRPVRLLTFSFAVAMAWRLGASAFASPHTARNLMYFHVPSRWFEWMLGLVAAEAYCGRLRLPRMCYRLAVGLSLLGAAGYLALHSVGVVSVGPRAFPLSAVLAEPLFGVGFFVCLNWFITREGQLLASRARWPLRLAAAIGVSSYSMYLLHPVIMKVVDASVPLTGISRRLVAWAAVVVGSYGFYLIVERRFIAAARRRQVSPPRAVHDLREESLGSGPSEATSSAG